MPHTTTLNKVIQMGVESTAGTTVAATKAFKMLTIDSTADLDIPQFDGTGRRFDVATGINRDQTSAKLGGPWNYTEIVYLLSSMFGAATITTPSGATLARNWKWQVPLNGSVTPKTLTVEEGDSVQAHKWGYGLVTGLSGQFTRDGKNCPLGGTMAGQNATDGITLTGALSGLAQIPILGKHLNWYLDTSWGSIGSTKYTSVYDCSWKWDKAFDVTWPMDRANASFASQVDTKPDTELMIKLENDSQGTGLKTNARANTTMYARLEAQGDLIEAGTPNQYYLLTIDMPVRITKLDAYENLKGIYGYGVHMTVIEDSTAGFGAVVNVVNTQTAL